MNTSILKKCLEELSKTTPDISYVRGMLETLLEVSTDGANQIRDIPMGNYPPNAALFQPSTNFPSPGKTVTADSPEGMAVEAALASIGMAQPNLNSLTLEKNIVLNPHV